MNQTSFRHQTRRCRQEAVSPGASGRRCAAWEVRCREATSTSRPSPGTGALFSVHTRYSAADKVYLPTLRRSTPAVRRRVPALCGRWPIGSPPQPPPRGA